MNDNYSFRKIEKDEILIIRPLWLRLNDIHYNDSVYFKEFYTSLTFEKRITKFTECKDDSIMIEIVETAGQLPVGYCISTAGHDGTGEIDSIFIEEGHRDKKLGDTLMRSSIDWLQKYGCSTIRAAVAHGHESVFSFYRKYGLFPRLTYLEMK